MRKEDTLRKMIATVEIITLLKRFKEKAASRYGIRLMGLFGSYVRNQQTENSDIDVFVALQEPDFFVLEKIKEELENLTHSSVDVVSFRDSLRHSFKKNILKDVILI